MMTCREIADFLMNYLDGELTQAEREVFEEHLGLCPECVTYLQTYRITVQVSHTACRTPDGNPCAEVPDRLVQAILAARREGG
jgi:anti-sigma factor RsiW